MCILTNVSVIFKCGLHQHLFILHFTNEMAYENGKLMSMENKPFLCTSCINVTRLPPLAMKVANNHKLVTEYDCIQHNSLTSLFLVCFDQSLPPSVIESFSLLCGTQETK